MNVAMGDGIHIEYSYVNVVKYVFCFQKCQACVIDVFRNETETRVLTQLVEEIDPSANHL